MNQVTTDFNTISFIDDTTVLVKVFDGAEVNAEKSLSANELIAKQMPGDYGLIIDRSCAYSIRPVEVYDVFNSMQRLKAIAIVLSGKSNFLPHQTEKKLFHGELNFFDSIVAAQLWLNAMLKPL